MRRWLLLLATTGCFSEHNPPPGECTPGDPGCDCASDGTCAEGNECVAAIDKCVPEDCTPGSRTCTCADGLECLGTLTCQEGVCLDPPPETTGDPTNASSSPSTTDATATEPMTSSPGTDAVTDTLTDTMPSDTSATTEPPMDTGSEMTGTTDPSTTMTSAETGVSVDCVQCLIDASTDMTCAVSFDACSGDSSTGGCSDLYLCITNYTDTVEACCESNSQTAGGHIFWGQFTDCAQLAACMMECPGNECPN